MTGYWLTSIAGYSSSSSELSLTPEELSVLDDELPELVPDEPLELLPDEFPELPFASLDELLPLLDKLLLPDGLPPNEMLELFEPLFPDDVPLLLIDEPLELALSDEDPPELAVPLFDGELLPDELPELPPELLLELDGSPPETDDELPALEEAAFSDEPLPELLPSVVPSRSSASATSVSAASASVLFMVSSFVVATTSSSASA